MLYNTGTFKWIIRDVVATFGVANVHSLIVFGVANVHSFIDLLKEHT